MHFWYHTVILYELAKNFVKFLSTMLSWSSKGIKNRKGTASCNSLLTLFWACFLWMSSISLHNILFICTHVQSCLTSFGHMDCSSPGFSVHGIFQAGILEQVAISSSRGYCHPGIKPASPDPDLAGRFFTTESPGKPLSFCDCILNNSLRVLILILFLSGEYNLKNPSNRKMVLMNLFAGQQWGCRRREQT